MERLVESGNCIITLTASISLADQVSSLPTVQKRHIFTPHGPHQKLGQLNSNQANNQFRKS